MSPTVKKFITRSPRYVIDENDSNFLLFKNDKPGSENCRAEFIDISGTGVAFIVESDFAPNFGEVIKLDFEVPGYQKVSWWGRVVRINEYSEQKWWKQTQTYEDLVFVGVHFHNLPEGQKEAIEKALYDKFKKIKIQRRKEKKQAIKAWVKTYGKTILIYSILTLVTFSLLWLLSRPSENYDKDRGSPWGKRFKFLLFDD